jgi:hypothetical protein
VSYKSIICSLDKIPRKSNLKSKTKKESKKVRDNYRSNTINQKALLATKHGNILCLLMRKLHHDQKYKVPKEV